MEQLVSELDPKFGFERVKENVWQLEGVRLRLSFSGESKGFPVTCETGIPADGGDAMSFVVQLTGVVPGKVDSFGTQLVVKQMLRGEDEFRALIQVVAKGGALLDAPQLRELQGFLNPLPPSQGRGNQIVTKLVDILRDHLHRGRVVQVRSASRESLLAYMGALGAPAMYEVKPYFLSVSAETEKLFGLCERLCAVNGALVVVNMDLLLHEQRTYAALIALFEQHNLLPDFFGGRFILVQNSGRPEDNALPLVQLLDIDEEHHQLLQAAGVGLKPSVLSRFKGIVRGGRTPEEAIRRMQEENRFGQEDQTHGTNRLRLERKRAIRRLGGETRSTAELLRLVHQIFEEQVVGHHEIKTELARRLEGWFTRSVDRPLVLAFVGPSGCGKNHLCEAIAQCLQRFFVLPKPRYVSFNAGQAQDEKLWTLTGVGIGHVGAQQKGILETGLTHNGTVFSIDELEKQLESRHDLQPFLLSLLEDNEFRNGSGKLVAMGRVVIVLTMNAGRSARDEEHRRIGFHAGEGDTDQVREHYQTFYEKNLLPALQGRVSRAFFFGPLTREDLMTLALRELRRVEENLRELGLEPPAASTEEIARQLVEKADPGLGARGIMQQVERFEDEMLERVCGNELL